MKLLNLFSFAALAAVGFAAAVLPKDVSSVPDRSEASVRLCPAKCKVLLSDCINKQLLGLDTCHQIKCQDRDCSNCDLECKKASSIVMASAVEPREIVAEGAEKQGATSENNASDDIELADSKNLFMKPSCPKYCVGNRQACKEKGGREAECNRQGCITMCLRMCEWCESFRAPHPPRNIVQV